MHRRRHPHCDTRYRGGNKEGGVGSYHPAHPAPASQAPAATLAQRIMKGWTGGHRGVPVLHRPPHLYTAAPPIHPLPTHAMPANCCRRQLKPADSSAPPTGAGTTARAATTPVEGSPQAEVWASCPHISHYGDAGGSAGKATGKGDFEAHAATPFPNHEGPPPAPPGGASQQQDGQSACAALDMWPRVRVQAPSSHQGWVGGHRYFRTHRCRRLRVGSLSARPAHKRRRTSPIHEMLARGSGAVEASNPSPSLTNRAHPRPVSDERVLFFARHPTRRPPSACPLIRDMHCCQQRRAKGRQGRESGGVSVIPSTEPPR